MRIRDLLKKKKKTNIEIVREIEEKIKTSSEYKSLFYRIWQECIAFLQGEQWVKWNTARAKFLRPSDWEKLDPNRVSKKKRVTINRILQDYRAIGSKICAQDFNLYATPPSGVDNATALMMVKKQNKILKGLGEKYDWESTRERIVDWFLACGTAFLLVTFDPSKGNLQDGEFEGELEFEVEGPFMIDVDPAAKNHEDLRWLARTQLVDKELLKEAYPEKSKDIKSDANSILDLGQIVQPVDGSLNDSTKRNLCRVVTYYEVPSVTYPDGRMYVYNGNTILYEGKDSIPNLNGTTTTRTSNPYRGIPAVRFSCVEVPECYWARGIVEDLIPPQRMYNAMMSIMLQNARDMAYIKWLTPRGGQIEQSSLNNDAGEVLQYNAVSMHKPEQVKPAQMPAYVSELMTRCLGDMQEISSRHEVSRSSVPPGVTSGVAINYLQEKDDATLFRIVRQMRGAWSKVGSLSLKVIADYYKNERKMSLPFSDSENGMVDTVSFSQKDIKSDETVVKVVRGLSDTRAVVRNYLMQMVQYGVLNPEEDRDKVLRMLEFGDVDEFFNVTRNDVIIARGENEAMEQSKGQVIPTNDFDNHPVHIGEHLNDLKEKLASGNASAEFAESVAKHVAEHREKIMQAQMQIMELAQGMSAGGGGGAVSPAAEKGAPFHIGGGGNSPA